MTRASDMKKSDDPWQHKSFVYLMACCVPPILILAIRIQGGNWVNWTTVVAVAITVAAGAVVAWLWIKLFGLTPTVDAPGTTQEPPADRHSSSGGDNPAE